MQDSLSLWNKNKHFFVGLQKQTGIKIFVFLLAFIQSRTLCVYKIRDKVEANIKKESKYQLLLRLFEPTHAEILIRGISRLILSLLFEAQAKIPLIMDRSNWKYGQRHINVLFLGILWNQSVFIPLCWMEIGNSKKRGNSDLLDRKCLIERFLGLMEGRHSEFVFLADREFVGLEFWDYLSQKKIDFVIRIREYLYIKYWAKEQGMSLEQARKKIQKGIEKKGVYEFCFVWAGTNYQVKISRNTRQGQKDKAFIFLASSMPQTEGFMSYYAHRWKIESCFKHLKSNGFAIESMSFKSKEKIEVACAFAALAYAYCIKEAIIETEQKGEIPKKRYKDSKIAQTFKSYPEISLFRLGYYLIENQLINLKIQNTLKQGKKTKKTFV